MSSNTRLAALFATSIFGLGLSATPSFAQQTGAGEVGEVVVTARRTEERLQDVPISITAFTPQQLSNRNITTAADLVTYTPSLSANTRFGPNAASFSIRGFAQEQRTTASVATYFGEVVSPRGQGGAGLTGGDGAGPGNLFDLQNIQVLNGPQGTLFGRNTTGGAVLLVPQRPSYTAGGYVEASIGDYGMRRLQAVFNMPLGDRVRVRVGMDRQEREGYLKNASPIGPRDFNDVNYEAYRLSVVTDVTKDIENYTIATYSHSLTNGTLSRAIACAPAPGFGMAGTINPNVACSDANLDPTTHRNNQGFYTVRNSVPGAALSLNVWQVQNITTWSLGESLTLKNVASYGEYLGSQKQDVYGSYFVPTAAQGFTGSPFNISKPEWFTTSGLGSNYDSAATKTYSNELQLQGRGFDGHLTWQGGLYYEETDPQRITGSLSETFWVCANRPSNDPLTWTGCDAYPANGANPAFQSATAAGLSAGAMHFQTQAIYFQADYSITDRLRATLGYRYTWDRTDGESIQQSWNVARAGSFPATTTNASIVATSCAAGLLANGCLVSLHNNTEAPTWLLGVDYKLTDESMIYAKYSRGYRQGSINLFAPAGFQSFKPEQLDAYEAGAKMGLGGALKGTLNAAVFYNKLDDAQLQSGFNLNNRPSTAILSGDVTTYGLELAANLNLTPSFNLLASYGYTHSNVDTPPPLGALVPTTIYHKGQALPNVPANKFSITGSYRLPLSDKVGDVRLGVTYSYIDKALLTPDNPTEFRYLNSYGLVNLNLNWDRIAGGPWNGSIFVTNALDKKYNAYESGTLQPLNYEVATAGAPRMIGVRLRYSFGGEVQK